MPRRRHHARMEIQRAPSILSLLSLKQAYFILKEQTIKTIGCMYGNVFKKMTAGPSKTHCSDLSTSGHSQGIHPLGWFY